VHTFTKLTVPEGSVGIHWFEQNSYAIKDSHSTIALVDPYFPHDRPAENFVHPDPPLEESRLPINYVLLTHSHSDHTCSETLARIYKSWPGARYVGPKESIEKILDETDINVAHTITVSAGETAQLRTMTAYAVYAKPPDGDPETGIGQPDVTHLGYVVEAGGVKLYFSGDEINTFADLDDMIKPVADLHPDIGFITMHPTEGEFPFVDGSIKMAQRIGLKTVVPAHYFCFVRRDYDPQEWAEQFPQDGPEPLIIPPNSHILYSVNA
jgi:L-ascorbate metabolism protein UlaG (beta-lactamase superfamily)